jgi:hypothetical protein
VRYPASDLTTSTQREEHFLKDEAELLDELTLKEKKVCLLLGTSSAA